MKALSRTPEGWRNHCPFCGNHVQVTPTWPMGEVPCPHCGQRLWFDHTATLRERPAATPGPHRFTLDDFRQTMEQLQKLGPLKQIMSSLSLNEKTTEMLANGDFDMVHDLKQIAGIIDSMTVQERQNPRLIDTNRRQRIAAGSGTKPTDIDTLIKEFLQMAWLMESMAKLSRRK